MVLLALAALAVAAALLVVPRSSSAATLSATPATIDSVFASAGGGDTIELASGDYGHFEGGMKPGTVTLEPAPGANVRMDLTFSPAANITVDGITVTGAFLADSRTHDITIRNSDVPGQVWLDTRELQDAGIVLANDVFRDWDKCDGCGEGRVFLTGGSQPSGVTIRDSEFYGGLSDGIQNGSVGTRIIGNEFHDITPGSPSGVHADAIQLYGSSHTVIRGNYMHDMPEVPFIMAADGADHELIEDNVVEGSAHGYPYITLFSDDSSIIRHNTFADGACAFNLPCGILRIGKKDGDPAGHGTVVEDNILAEISIEAGSVAQRSHNLLAHDNPSGAADMAGLPTYVGGASPSSYAGYRLAAGSLGKGNASDGLDRGARIDSGPPPPPPPPPPDAPAEAMWTAPGGAEVGVPVTLDGTGSSGDGPLTCTWSFENLTGTQVFDTRQGCLISFTFESAGTKYVKLTVEDADGDVDSLKRSFFVSGPDQPSPGPDADCRRAMAHLERARERLQHARGRKARRAARRNLARVREIRRRACKPSPTDEPVPPPGSARFLGAPQAFVAVPGD